MSEHEDQAVALVDEQPVPALAGTFAIYETPDGGYLLVTETDRGIDRKHIPGKLIRLATKGPMSKMFGGLFGDGTE